MPVNMILQQQEQQQQQRQRDVVNRQLKSGDRLLWLLC
jgi:hypothetical protein